MSQELQGAPRVVAANIDTLILNIKAVEGLPSASATSSTA